MATITDAPVEVDDIAYVEVADAGEDFTLTFVVPFGVRLAYAATQPAADSGIGHFLRNGQTWESKDATEKCWIIAYQGDGTFTKTREAS